MLNVWSGAFTYYLKVLQKKNNATPHGPGRRRGGGKYYYKLNFWQRFIFLLSNNNFRYSYTVFFLLRRCRLLYPVITVRLKGAALLQNR